LTKKVAYNWKTTGQILMQFVMVMYLRWLHKSHVKSELISAGSMHFCAHLTHSLILICSVSVIIICVILFFFQK